MNGLQVHPEFGRGPKGTCEEPCRVGSLLKFTSTRAAFARPVPGATPFPDVHAPTRPSDSLMQTLDS